MTPKQTCSRAPKLHGGRRGLPKTCWMVSELLLLHGGLHVNQQQCAVPPPQRGLRPLNLERKYLSHSLRLSNNRIADLAGLQHVVIELLAEPPKLGWLDLSYNKISFLDPILCELRKPRVLYLHGNDIWNLSDVDKLGELQYLHTITLHGNEIETQRGYRHHVISVLTQLKRMDFSTVTREQRILANVWHRCSKTPKEWWSDCYQFMKTFI